MNTFCPFFKEKCKGNECVMWRDEKCLIISFMECLSTYPGREAVGGEPIGRAIGKFRQTEITDDIMSAAPEELAAQLLSFYKNESRGVEGIELYMVTEAFWKTKFGINKRDAPPEIELRMTQVETIAGNLLDAEEDRMRDAELNAQKEKLPFLVDLCFVWAKDNGFKTVTQRDIRVCLAEKNEEDILPQILSRLCAQVNVKLKSKR